VTCIGSAFQAGANGPGAYSMMIVGRIICGLGIAVVSTSVPLYQRFVASLQSFGMHKPQKYGLLTTHFSEIAPAHDRGRYVVMNHIGLVGGLAGAFWYGPVCIHT